MNTTVEPLEGNLVKVTITVPAEQVDKAIAEAYAGVAKQVRVPGFRKGKAPRPVIDTYVGRERVLAEAQEELVQTSYAQAVEDKELRVIEQPDVGELAGIVEGEDYTFSAEVEVRPELELSGDYEKLTIQVPPKEASEADVDEALENMRERFASLEPVEDRGVEDGDFVLISFTGLVDGELYEGNQVDKYLYETGRGQMPKEFDDALMGAKPGDEVKAEFVIPDTSANQEFVGKTATFDITVHEIKSKHLPELDDEFAGNAGGFDSVGELRRDMKKRLDQQKGLQHMQETEREARIALAAHLEGDAPKSMIDRRRDNMLREFFGSLQQRGISLQDYVQGAGVDPEQIQKDIEEEAAARVKQELALEALFRAQGMNVTEADMDAEVADMAGASDKDPAELRREWEEAGVIAVLKESVMHRKAVEWLLEHAEIVEKAPEPEAAEASAEEKPKKARKSAKKKEE